MRLLLLLYFVAFSAAEARSDLHRNFDPELKLAECSQWVVTRLTSENKVSLKFKLLKFEGQGPEANRPASTTLEHLYVPTVASAILLSAEIHRIQEKSYLVTVWQEGVHFTSLRIFDPLNVSQSLIWERGSFGDLKYDLIGTGLRAHLYKPAKGQQEVTLTSETWRPKK